MGKIFKSLTEMYNYFDILNYQLDEKNETGILEISLIDVSFIIQRTFLERENDTESKINIKKIKEFFREIEQLQIIYLK